MTDRDTVSASIAVLGANGWSVNNLAAGKSGVQHRRFTGIGSIVVPPNVFEMWLDGCGGGAGGGGGHSAAPGGGGGGAGAAYHFSKMLFQVIPGGTLTINPGAGGAGGAVGSPGGGAGHTTITGTGLDPIMYPSGITLVASTTGTNFSGQPGTVTNGGAGGAVGALAGGGATTTGAGTNGTRIECHLPGASTFVGGGGSGGGAGNFSGGVGISNSTLGSVASPITGLSNGTAGGGGSGGGGTWGRGGAGGNAGAGGTPGGAANGYGAGGGGGGALQPGGNGSPGFVELSWQA